MNGRWDLSISEISENCGDGLGPPENISGRIEQTGSAVRLIAGGESIDGALAGDMLTLPTWCQPDDGGDFCQSAALTASPDCDSIDGDISWTWDDGDDFCSGTDRLAATCRGSCGGGGGSAGGGGASGPDMTPSTSVGVESYSISVKKGPQFGFEGPVTLDINESGGGFLSGPIGIAGDVDDSAKKPIFSVSNWSEIEEDLASEIEAADSSFDPATVVIDQSKAKVKMSAKEKQDLDVKLDVSFPFVLNGMYGATKTSFKSGKGGGSVTYSFQAEFLADFSIDGQYDGKIAIKSKMSEVGSD